MQNCCDFHTFLGVNFGSNLFRVQKRTFRNSSLRYIDFQATSFSSIILNSLFATFTAEYPKARQVNAALSPKNVMSSTYEMQTVDRSSFPSNNWQHLAATRVEGQLPGGVFQR